MPETPSFSLPQPEPKEEAIDSLRGRLRSAFQGEDGADQDKVAELNRLLDSLISIAKEGLSATRKVRVQGHKCPKGCVPDCPHIFFVEATDPKMARETISWLAAELEGRPGLAGVEQQGVVVKRYVAGIDDQPK